MSYSPKIPFWRYFVERLKSIDTFTGKNGAKFSTWLYDIARNYCIDILRKRKRVYIDADEALLNVPSPAQAADRVLEVKQRAESAWAVMNETERRFIDLLQEGFCYEQAAKDLNITMPELYRMIRTIRQKMETLETLAQTRSGE